jgi:hypothetical protein
MGIFVGHNQGPTMKLLQFGGVFEDHPAFNMTDEKLCDYLRSKSISG